MIRQTLFWGGWGGMGGGVSLKYFAIQHVILLGFQPVSGFCQERKLYMFVDSYTCSLLLFLRHVYMFQTVREKDY